MASTSTNAPPEPPVYLPPASTAEEADHAPSVAQERKSGGVQALPHYQQMKNPRPLKGGAGCLATDRCYLRRRIAYVRTPEPSSSAAAGRSMAGPPLPGSGCLP